MAPDAVAVLAEEANAVLECLRHKKPVLPHIPIISALCMQGGVHIELGFFTFHQDLVIRGVAHFLDGVGKFVFDDRMHALLQRSETGLILHPPELTAPYTSQLVAVPEDCRSMFITFSKGNAIHREEIFEYFRHLFIHIDLLRSAWMIHDDWNSIMSHDLRACCTKWGDCVVRVLMEKTKGGHMPMYGRIIFKTEAIVKLVLNGERLVKISIGQCEIWLRKYVPRPTNTAA
uniref:Uncharacterized protein n=1 Tax=Triticum aestivum TaxID=4565 RepID=A0A077RWN6_WHEAT|nr:unnamed protein product [Triticum aestivum]